MRERAHVRRGMAEKVGDVEPMVLAGYCASSGSVLIPEPGDRRQREKEAFVVFFPRSLSEET